MVGIGSDGAANMMGKNNGLSAMLKNDHPELVAVHCLCHRLELAFKDALKIKRVKDNHEKLMTLLTGLHYFYKKSHKQKQGLLSAMEILQIKGTLPPKATGKLLNHNVTLAFSHSFICHFAQEHDGFPI